VILLDAASTSENADPASVTLYANRQAFYDENPDHPQHYVGALQRATMNPAALWVEAKEMFDV
jgi:hypothetical protein